MTRRQLRRQMRSARRALPELERARSAQSAAQAACLWRAPLARARSVSAYLADDGELDPAPLVMRLRAAGKRIYVPVFRNRQMWFAPLAPRHRLVTGRFGLSEPADVSRRLRRLRCIDLALVPLVAIDYNGNRLGRGGGFYDRAFGARYVSGRWRRPIACGLAYQFQQVSELPAQPWDAPISYLLTDERFSNLAEHGTSTHE